MYNFLLTLQGCINTENPRLIISPELRNNYFIPADSVKPIHTIKVTNCKEPLPYSDCNLDCEFSEAIFMLSEKLAQIPDTLRLLKFLCIADFVYAAFSYEYLYGINYQKCEQLYKFDSLSVWECFEIGNQNVTSVYCGERSIFFQKLVDILIPTEYFRVNVNDKHTFPVVNIGSSNNPQWFIIDPYDPFVVIDSNNRALDIFSLLQGKQGIVYRTQRTFGSTHQLVADSLILNMPAKNKDFCNMVSFTDSMFGVLKSQMENRIENFLTFNLNNADKLPDSSYYTYTIEDFGRPDSFYFAQL